MKWSIPSALMMSTWYSLEVSYPDQLGCCRIRPNMVILRKKIPMVGFCSSSCLSVDYLELKHGVVAWICSKGWGWSKFFKAATSGCSWQTFHVTGKDHLVRNGDFWIICVQGKFRTDTFSHRILTEVPVEQSALFDHRYSCCSQAAPFAFTEPSSMVEFVV